MSDQEIEDPTQDRRDENIENPKPVYIDFRWCDTSPTWEVGPGVLRRAFDIEDTRGHRTRCIAAQIAGFSGNLAELLRLCNKVTRAVEDDYEHILSMCDAGREPEAWFSVDGCVVSVSDVPVEMGWY
jgi:hypothetical protein